MNVSYGACECTVWPLVVFNGTGPCGRCGEAPRDRYPTFREAADAFRAEHGREPVDPRPTDPLMRRYNGVSDDDYIR